MGKNVLILAAHGDDEILGTAGAIQFFKDKGYNVYVCLATEGCLTQYEKNKEVCQEKRQQYKKAMELLGADEIIELNFPDMQLDTIPHFKLNQAISRVLEKIQPEILFTHNPVDINLDHRLVYHSTLVAIRPPRPFLKKIYTYEVPSSSEWNPKSAFLPNYFISIEKYLKKKKQALALLKTELRNWPHPRSLEGLEALARFRGMQSGCKYSEAFCLIKSYD